MQPGRDRGSWPVAGQLSAGDAVWGRGCRTGPRRMANLCTLPKSRNRGQNYVRPAKGSRQQCNSQTEPRQQIAQKIVEQQKEKKKEREMEMVQATALVANGCEGYGRKFKQLFIMKYNKKW